MTQQETIDPIKWLCWGSPIIMFIINYLKGYEYINWWIVFAPMIFLCGGYILGEIIYDVFANK